MLDKNITIKCDDIPAIYVGGKLSKLAIISTFLVDIILSLKTNRADLLSLLNQNKPNKRFKILLSHLLYDNLLCKCSFYQKLSVENYLHVLKAYHELVWKADLQSSYQSCKKTHLSKLITGMSSTHGDVLFGFNRHVPSTLVGILSFISNLLSSIS